MSLSGRAGVTSAIIIWLATLLIIASGIARGQEKQMGEEGKNFGSSKGKGVFPEEIPLEHFSYFRYPVDVVGFKDAREGAEITPEGYIYTGFTELIFLYGEPLAYFPLREHYWLEKEYLPIHHWVQNLAGCEYRFTAFAAPLALDPEKNLIVFLKISVTNKSEDRQRPRFALASRYLPPESEGNGRYAPRLRFRRPAEQQKVGTYCQAGEEFSADWKFEFEEDALLRDGKALFLFKSELEPELFSYRGYPTEAGEEFLQPAIASSPVGIAVFSETLQPGESFEIEIRMPYSPAPYDSDELRRIAALDMQAMKERVVAFWEDLLAQGMQVEIPEAKAVRVYKAGLIYDLIARDKIGDDYVQKVNEFHYDAFWLRDSAYIVRSYDLGGYHETAGQCLDFFFKWQTEEGNFLSQGGQFDGWGQTLWAMGQHYRLTRDKEFGEKALPEIMKAAAWLSAQMDGDPYGVMPVTTPGDNEAIQGGHVTGHNFWALAGLKNAVALAEGLGRSEEAAELKALYDRLHSNLMKVFDRLLEETGNYIPPGLEGPGGQDWGNLMSVYPEEILPPDHPAVTETLRVAKEKYRERLMTYGDTKWMHHYLTMKNTETWVIRGDQEEALDEFYSILAHTSSTQAGFEFSIRPWADRDFHANLTPHGWFAAKYRNLLRSFLVRERGDSLHLLSVVSPAWAKPGDRIAVKDAPTYFGKVSYEAVFSEDGVEISLQTEFFEPPREVVVHVPYFAVSVQADKGELTAEGLILPPDTDKVTIHWRRNSQAQDFSYERMVKRLVGEYQKPRLE
jgi:hypothetical protein